MKIAEGNGGRGAGNDDAGIAKSDEGDEEADPSTDCGVELIRNCGEESLADAGVSEPEEDDTGEEDGTERGLPRDMHAFDNGVGKVGVEAHAGSESQRIVGQCSHQDAAEGCAEAGSGGNGSKRHAGFRENGRVDEDDVGHGDESGEAGEDFGAPVGGVGGKAEVELEASSDGGQGGLLLQGVG